MIDLQDHPAIRNMERTGSPDGKAPKAPICPVCGAECETVYRTKEDGEVIGCDRCAVREYSWECDECFPEEG